jgi:flavodoxin/ferredoxin
LASAIVVYYSVSGTTHRVADGIAQGLADGGVDCELHDLRAAPVPELKQFDIVGVGSPVHYYRLPEPVSDALKTLGSLDGVSSFSFVTHSTYRGNAQNTLRRALSRAGATEVGAFTSFGEGLFLGYLRQGYLFAPGHPDSSDLERAREFGIGVAEAHHELKAGGPPPRAPAFDPATGPVYVVERALTAPALAHSVHSRFFHADPKSCSRCGRCAHDCPTGNISYTRGQVPSWGRDCILCATCVVVCPSAAVRCPLDWAVFAPFYAYNVRQAAGDPNMEWKRAHLEAGKIDGTAIRISR